MKKYNKIKRFISQNDREAEARWKTKKSKKARIYIAVTILSLLALNQLINTVQAAFLPDPIVIEGKPLSWDTRIAEESVAVTSGDESKDGVVVIGGIEGKIAKMFPEDPELMIAVAKAESGLNPKAIHKNTNGTLDIGIFQINTVHGYDQLSLTDVDTNIKAARTIYEKQGLTAWSVVNNGAYKKHLEQ